MIEKTRRTVPDNHPIHGVFHELIKRGMGQLPLRDQDTIEYVTNLLIEFVHTENMYRIQGGPGREFGYVCDLLEQRNSEMPPALRSEYYRHMGDCALFSLGLFPEALTYGRRTVSPGFYAEQGRRSYTIVADMAKPDATVFFRKLSEQFEQCVVGLNWVKLYINDPFYQYMLREFQVI